MEEGGVAEAASRGWEHRGSKGEGEGANGGRTRIWDPVRGCQHDRECAVGPMRASYEGRGIVGASYREGEERERRCFASWDGRDLVRAPMPVTTTFLFFIVDMRSEVLDEVVRLLDTGRGAPPPAKPIASGSAAMASTAAAVHTRTYIWRGEGRVRE